MPTVQRQLVAKGMRFDNAMVSNSLCCPSRSSILTGDYSHLTKVYTNVYSSTSPWGGYQAFRNTGDQRDTIAVWLQNAGYRTGLVGKYLNEYPGGPGSTPPGWDYWTAFDNSTKNSDGAYYDYNIFKNIDGQEAEEPHASDPTDYSTDVLSSHAHDFLTTAPPEQPLFLYLAPFAPHGPATPAPRDLNAFSHYKPTLPPSFNESAIWDKPKYVSSAPLLTKFKAAQQVRRYRTELASLQAVDRMVAGVLNDLQQTGRLQNTLIVFMSDNGIAFGEHRWTYKLTPYEESIRVPMVVRYDADPSLVSGSTSDALAANVDIAPTFADFAGVTPGPTIGSLPLEGASLRPVLESPGGAPAGWRTSLLLEHLAYRGIKLDPPTFCGIRTRNRLYVAYGSGEQEYYNLTRDPYELQNKAGKPRVKASVSALRSQLDPMCQPRPPGYTFPVP